MPAYRCVRGMSTADARVDSPKLVAEAQLCAVGGLEEGNMPARECGAHAGEAATRRPGSAVPGSREHDERQGSPQRSLFGTAMDADTRAGSGRRA